MEVLEILAQWASMILVPIQNLLEVVIIIYTQRMILIMVASGHL